MLDLSLGTFTHKAHLALVPYSACHRDEQLPPDDNLPCSYDKECCVTEALEAKFGSIPGNVSQNVTIATNPSPSDDNTIFVLKETKKPTKTSLLLGPTSTAYYLLAGYLHYRIFRFKKKMNRASRCSYLKKKKKVLCLFIATFPHQVYLCHGSCCFICSHFLFFMSQVPHGGTSDSTLLRGLSWLRGVTDAVCIPKLVLEGGLVLSSAMKVNHAVGWGNVLFSEDLATKSDMGRKS